MKGALAIVICFWAVLFILISINGIQASAAKPPKLKSILLVDHLIQTLEYEEWPDDEACREATLRLLNGVKNDTLWATSMWDSMQPPLGVFYGNGVSLGSYDQCLQSPWSSEISAQYCLIEVKIQKPKATREFGPYDSADEYLNTLLKTGKILNHFDIGVCMPAVCSPSSITRFYRHVLRTTHLPEAEVVTLDSANCQGVEPEPYPKKYYAFWALIRCLLGVVVLSTIYTRLNKTKSSSHIDIFARSFCVVRNWEDLLKISPTEIRTFGGLKSFSSIMVICGHMLGLSLFDPSIIINHLDIDKTYQGLFGHLIGHIDLMVDTFFVVSGLLLAKSLLSGRQNNLLLLLFKRYLRLMSPYAVMTLYMLCVAPYAASGPLWPKACSDEEDVCKVHWWKNFLMINTDWKTMCFQISWYVTCDYHLAILVVILYWIYRRNQKAGVLAFAAVGCGLTLQLAVKAYILKAPLEPMSNLHTLANVRSYEVMNDVYIMWHDRAGSYLVGVAMGWLMTKYKLTEYRNTISKQTSLIIAAVSLYILFKIGSIGYWLSEGRMEVAVAVATNRIVWAVGICGLIGACEYGSVPVIGNFLRSAVFAVLGKLSYAMYMTHFFIIQRNVHVTRSPLSLSVFQGFKNGLGAAVMSFPFSLILYMLVEAPCINLSNYYLSEKKKDELNTKPVNRTVLENGTKRAQFKES